MIAIVVPDELAISVEGACDISLECWRLGKLAESQKDSNEGADLRRAVRHIAETLNAMEIEIIDFADRIYDPGLVPEVVEVRLDDTISDGLAVVEETIAPTVTWRGQVIKRGQIIVRRSLVDQRKLPQAGK
jgi:hypothetical protein